VGTGFATRHQGELRMFIGVGTLIVILVIILLILALR
jgi:hypothetical protein